ncbi:MAG: DNA gyrase subunit A [Deltaproteobacteria bacterium RIFCSPLOWO2_12_FULL_43_16]|nr:MAG: DNA gyrase subunit A [Deltaproteobacteria bacterium RIFCSPHIGHO2_02_FULL_43_33]OGQ60882.1 MAG: DNA gyrase subunit A [Deltaproteobacteria bacterium RIFCSPLOWO2_12_FULL_43_16]
MSQEKIPVYIEDEMKKSYLGYAMSVIVGRALPDVRDGLKPVHRRILYAMHEMGVEWNKPYKKSARVVGDVIGKYHPHGDTAVYDAMVRMVQDFSLRYPLIDGQGNFGSIDGDSPAAMRYTEVRMSRLSGALLADIEKETVDWGPNYDESLKEPLVMPAAFPNLLVNGSSGIAVGMATNMPPHNLSEVIDGIVHIINKPDATIKELMKLIPGPDFPTAGFIHGKEGIKAAYETGRGIIQMRARATTEKNPRTNRQAIVITEIPYQVNKEKLIKQIAELVNDKKIEGISHIRDESDREGMRIFVELKRDEVAEVILNNLFLHTQMQTTFGIINLAIVDGQPRVLNLKQLLELFVRFRKEVVTRRTIFELKKARERAHILEGLKIALDNLDAVITLIRKSKSPQEAKEGLMNKFKLSDVQAQAILDMRLQRLTALEREKIVEEYKEVLKLIKRLEEILASEKLLIEVIVDELKEIKKQFGDERRTEIIEKTGEITMEDIIAEEDMMVNISHGGYIKRNPTSLFRTQKRGGKGRTGMTTKEEDFVENMFVASTHSYILFFTDKGKTYSLKVYDIPQAGPAAKGKAIVNLLNLAQGEKMTAFLPVKEFTEGKFIVMATKHGVIKKTDLTVFANIRSGGLIALGLDEGDELIATRLTDGSKEIFLGTKEGQAIRFNESQVRDMGRVARGVRAINLGKKDVVVSMEAIEEGMTILTVTERGYGKRTELKEYRSQLRGGSGIINIKVTEKNGHVVGIAQVRDEDELMITTNIGKIIRIAMKGVSVIGRNTQGVRLIDVEKEERVTGIAPIAEKEEEEGE